MTSLMRDALNFWLLFFSGRNQSLLSTTRTWERQRERERQTDRQTDRHRKTDKERQSERFDYHNRHGFNIKDILICQ